LALTGNKWRISLPEQLRGGVMQPELLLYEARQAPHYQRVGVINHVLDFTDGHRTIQHNGIPVSFIHVIARQHGGKDITQHHGLLRVTLYIHLPVVAALTQGGEHLFADFEYRNIQPEGIVLKRLGFT